jgi:predicted esterase
LTGDAAAVTGIHAIETPTHGRVLVVAASDGAPAGRLVAFHGYAQSADDVLAEVAAIPGASRWHLLAVQALNRFYARGDEKVIANWMTRQDRELAIADNIAYVDRVIDGIVPAGNAGPRLVFVGFSQGASMAYRAARLGRHRAAGVIALGGDIPPEIKTSPVGAAAWPPVLIGAGDAETWFTPEKVGVDVAFLASQGAAHEVVRYRGGHLWTDEFRAAAGRWLAALP